MVSISAIADSQTSLLTIEIYQHECYGLAIIADKKEKAVRREISLLK